MPLKMDKPKFVEHVYSFFGEIQMEMGEFIAKLCLNGGQRLQWHGN